MKLIPLTKGQWAIVDDQDYDELSKYKWHLCNSYASRSVWHPALRKKTMIYMHRVVAQTHENLHTDHINLDKLDNRRSNLRTCTNQQNQFNKPHQSNSTTGFKGVFLPKKSKKYTAKIGHNRQQIYIGTYNTKEEAELAYKEKAKSLFGEFARV